MTLFRFIKVNLSHMFSPEARRGSHGASRAAPGESGLHARGEGVSRRMEIILNANFSLSSAAVKIRTLSAEGFKEIQVELIRIRQGS